MPAVAELLAPGGFVVLSVWRHPGDQSLWRIVDNAFPVLARVEVRNRANAVNPRGWIVACCRPAPGVVGGTAGSRESGELQLPLARKGDDAGKGGAGGAAVEG